MVYFFTKGTISAGSSRHRAFLVAEFLNKRNIKTKVIIPPVFEKNKNKFVVRLIYLRNIFSPRKKDTVVLQTAIFNKLFIFLIILSKKIFKFQLIFDFDDAIYKYKLKETKKILTIADKVIVASNKLYGWDNIKSKPKLIMPNLIDAKKTNKFIRNNFKRSDIVFGWIGGAPESINNLKILEPIFEKVVQKKYKINFHLIGLLNSQEVKKIFSNIKNLNFTFVNDLNWAKENEIEKALQKVDVGLSPLQDDEDNWARCSLKVLNYMSVGLPVIGSNIGENNNFINNNVTGYLCEVEDEWVEKIIFFLEHKNKIQKMGRLGRDRLVKKFSYQNFIKKYIDFINK